jgi:hypothetical protein
LFESGRTVTAPQDTLVLGHLWRLEKHIHSFTNASLGVNNVTTFYDLEIGVVSYLRGFMVSHLNSFKGPCSAKSICQTAVAPNPEEIDIDDVGDECTPASAEVTDDAIDAHNFDKSFGIGPLSGHPSVAYLFKSMGQRCLPEADVFSHLLSFLDRPSNTAASAADVPLAEFGAFVAAAESVTHLAELGVFLRPQPSGRGLAAECQVVRHVQHKRMLRQAAAVGNLLRQSDWASDGEAQTLGTSAPQVPLPKRSRGESSSSSHEEARPVMARPSRPDLVHFLEHCRERLCESPYSPSFLKLRKVVSALVAEQKVEKKIKPQPAAATKGKGKDKGNFDTGHNNNELLVDISTEWAMLHLGGEKYRARAIQIECHSSAADGYSKEELGSAQDTSDDDAESSQSDPPYTQKRKVADKNAESPPGQPTVVQTSYSRGVSAPRSNAKASAEEVVRNIANSTDKSGWMITVGRPTVTPSEPAQLGGSSGSGIGGLSEGAWACLPWGQPPLDRSDGRAVGRWGEAFVSQLLLQKYPPETGAVVEWVNEKDETRAAYDLKVTFTGLRARATWGGAWSHPRKNETVFIEVKTTASDRLSTFELSLQEWDFATRAVGSSLVTYHVYRVYGAGHPSSVRVQVVEDILQSIEAKRVRLCLSI